MLVFRNTGLLVALTLKMRTHMICLYMVLVKGFGATKLLLFLEITKTLNPKSYTLRGPASRIHIFNHRILTPNLYSCPPKGPYKYIYGL